MSEVTLHRHVPDPAAWNCTPRYARSGSAAVADALVFSAWYFHFALRQCPDLVVVATDLLHFDWYQEVLRSTYPALIVPGPFPFPETIAQANAARPFCTVQYSDPILLDCSPPGSVRK